MNNTKEKVLALLTEKNMNYVSGQEIADTLFITRAGIWKAVKSLRESGYNIEAVSNRGYRLLPDRDSIEKEAIEAYLRENNVKLKALVMDEVDSTNDYARELASKGAEDLFVVSDFQKKGRGRRGRSFFSPKGMGLYTSFLLHPKLDVSKAGQVTCMAAVAVCKTIEALTDKKPMIKWVNDIFVDERKVCGILTEGYTSIEDGSLSYIIVGIGINFYPSREGFPEDIKKTAGVLFQNGQQEDGIRNRFMGHLAYEFMKLYLAGEEADFIEDYKKRSFLIGHYVRILSAEKESGKGYAKVLGIDDECHLLVEYEDGRKEALSTGEVSVVKY